MRFARWRKAAVAGAGSVLMLAAQIIPDGNPWKALATALLALGTTYGVWKVENAKTVQADPKPRI